MTTQKRGRERKELACGRTKEEAIRNHVVWLPSIDGPTTHAACAAFDPKRHECVKDEKTGMWQVFNKRNPHAGDRTVRKPIIRESRGDFATYGKDKKRIMLMIDGQTIGMYLKGRRRKSAFQITWHDLYSYLARCAALAKSNEKRSRKAAQKKARAEQRKLKLARAA